MRRSYIVKIGLARAAPGASAVAKADPDGYTLLLNSSTMSSQIVLHKSLPYDVVKDFAPIALFGIQPSVLITSPSKGYKTVADIVAAAKAKPGTLNFASAGIGAASHMAAERFRVSAKLDVQHIPYKGPVEAFTDVMAGRIDYYYLPIAPALPNIQSGKIVALAVSTPKRAPSLPNVPTIVEAGYPDATYLFWGGISGLLYIYYHKYIHPTSLSITSSAEALLGVIAGGSGTLGGPAIGAALVLLLKNYASAYVERWNMLLGLVFLFIVLVMPTGIVPGLSRLAAAIRRGSR